MQAGDIVFVRGNSLVSRLVLLIDRGRFSHVAIAVSDSDVIETNWNMQSKVVPFHYDDYEIVTIELKGNQRRRIPIVAKRYEGRMYDYLQVLAYIFKGRLNNPRHLICSELVYNILSEVGYIHDECLRDITPNELYTLLTDRGEWMDG
ncbi:hypothetical protein [Bacillus sp. Bos-x628]|uniref:hypothetical protein n=1 Tax=Bacillus maqinnsis TaxID=3229854 RepID=UPI00338FAFA0